MAGSGSFRRALLQVVQISFVQSGVFLLGVAVAAPAQTSVVSKGSPSAASPQEYVNLTRTNLTMVLTLVGSVVSAMSPIHRIRDGGDITGEGFSLRFVRLLRVAAFVAVLLSMATMALGLSVTYQLLVVKTYLPFCWSSTTTGIVIASYGVISTVCVAYYLETFRVVIFCD